MVRNCSARNGLEGTVFRQDQQDKDGLEVTLWSPSGSGSVNHSVMSDSL